MLTMKSRLADALSLDLEVGSKVKITGGNYRYLDGVVVDLYPQKVAVRVDFRSLTSIIVVPRNLATFAGDLTENPDSGMDSDLEVESISLDEILGGIYDVDG